MIRAKVVDLGHRVQIEMSKTDFDKVKSDFEFEETLHYFDGQLVYVTDDSGDIEEHAEHISQILAVKARPDVRFEGFNPDPLQKAVSFGEFRNDPCLNNSEK